ncbi:hypothetical protein BSLG_005229 [Batrachochytrium salamandrivorans]|nr:hypothetical protein BSLG_005229 [Batrachochytrium salamandrivorans]
MSERDGLKSGSSSTKSASSGSGTGTNASAGASASGTYSSSNAGATTSSNSAGVGGGSLPVTMDNTRSTTTTKQTVNHDGSTHAPILTTMTSPFSGDQSHSKRSGQSPILSAPEGAYVLRDEILAETYQSGPLHINPRYGTQVSIISVKSVDTQARQTTLPIDGSLGNHPVFTEIPINGDGAGSFMFLKSVKSGIKKVKPPLAKSTSQFVSKILANEHLARIISFRANETTYFFFNAGKSFFWADYACNAQQNPLSVIQFKDSVVSCHDANLLTRETMDNVLGFSTGDILWYSPISGKFARLNRGGAVYKHAVRSIKWMPGSDTHFMAGFEDGSVLVFDKDLEDQAFTAPATRESFVKSKSSRQSKYNPVDYWKVGQKGVTAISFSPDCQHVAITSMDGSLSVMDFVNGRVIDVYKSFFGGLLCVSWSPDGKFILAGGQDDLVSVWAFQGRIVARCQGHTSWVSSVAFDPYRCTDRSYRFGSVGDDTRLCLWDFSISSLHRPRSMYGSMSRVRSQSEMDRRSYSDSPIIHDVLPKAQVPIIESFAQRKDRDNTGISVQAGPPSYASIPIEADLGGAPRSILYSPLGKYLVLLFADRLVLSAVTPEAVTVVQELPIANILEIEFSPRETYISTYIRYTPPTDPTAPAHRNVTIWHIETGMDALSFTQKQPADWNVKWVEDESYCGRLVGNEVQFYESKNFSKGISDRLKMETIKSFSMSPGRRPVVAVFIPEKNGCPGSVKLYDVTNLKQPLSEIVLPCRYCTNVLVFTHTDVDITGKSYYGETSLYYLSITGNFDCKVTLGFGNLSGDMDIWDRRSFKKIATVNASNSSSCEWSPDGKHIMTSILYKRLKVDNGIKIWHYTGALVHQIQVKEMYQTVWMPASRDLWPDRAALSPPPKSLATPALPASEGKYRPPGARNAQSTTSFYDRDAIDKGTIPGGRAAIVHGAKPATAAKLRKKQNGKNGANATSPTSTEPVPAVPAPITVGMIPGSNLEVEKKIRTLSKKLKQIDDLKMKQAAGDALELTQIQKISSEESVKAEIAKLTLSIA